MIKEERKVRNSNIELLRIIAMVLIVMVTSPSALNWTEGKHKAVSNWCQENQIMYVDYNETEEMRRISYDWSTDTRDNGDHANQAAE